MNNCCLYKDKSRLMYDASIIDVISMIIKLAQTKLKIAATKAEVFALERIISIGKKLLAFKSKLPPSELLKKYIKAHYDLLRLNISATMKKFIMWSCLMLEKSYKKQEVKEKAEAAARAAAEAVQKAATSKNDSDELVRLYRDGKYIVKTLKQLRRALIGHKIEDDRRRISTTKTPTMWEMRYVLGIKPGVSFYEKDWKAYKENGFIIVENKRTGQRYQKPQSDVVAAANNERASRINTADPYLNSGDVQYGEGELAPQQKNSLVRIIKKIGAVIASVTGVVTAIKALKSNASGWSNALRDFLANTLSWLHTAKETWKTVNSVV